MKYIILLILLLSSNLASFELRGKIIHISDGDTVHLLTSKNEKIKFFATGKEYGADEVGTLKLKQVPKKTIGCGDVGYLV